MVAENGALVFEPASGKKTTLAEPPPRAFLDRLRQRNVQPLSAGRVIVATREPHQREVIDAISGLGLELQVIFNKGAVMVVPSGVDKATGLKCALEQLGLSGHNLAGIGDAENDHAFLAACECSVAVANALPSVKERADLVTAGVRGEGVAELIAKLLEDDLASLASRLERHDIFIGTTRDGSQACLPVWGSTILLAGTGGGKSTLISAFMERLRKAEYQFCAIDPEGDYETFPDTVVLGDAQRVPGVDEVMSVLAKPGRNVIVNLLGVRMDDRPDFFRNFMPAIAESRECTGRPHWLIVDEAHHVLPAMHNEPAPPDLSNTLLVTLEPERISPGVVKAATHVIVVGAKPDRTLSSFGETRAESVPHIDADSVPRGQAILWRSKPPGKPVWIEVAPG